MTFTGPIDKVILGSRRRPRRISGTLGPRKSVPEEVEPEDENTQQQNGTLPKDTAWIEPGTAEWNNTKLETDSIIQPTSSDLNPESTELRGRACSPKVNGCVGMGTERPIIPKTDSLDPLGRSEKENDRAKWFVQDTNSMGQKEQASPFVVNGGIGSTCSSKRPSLASSKGSSEEMDSDQLHTLEIPMRQQKSLSDSLLCTVQQNDTSTINSDLSAQTPSDQNIDREHSLGELQGKLSPSAQRKQNYSKQNGSPLPEKKALFSNGPCCKHSDDELNIQRNRTTTHPCYDPMDLPKRRRNAACTVAILSPSDRASDNDFLETKI